MSRGIFGGFTLLGVVRHTSLPGLFLLRAFAEPVLRVCERLGCIPHFGGTVHANVVRDSLPGAV